MIDPVPVTLEGNGIRLEPLERDHAAALVAAADDGQLWKTLSYISVGDVTPERIGVYIDTALDGLRAGHMVPWVVRELGSGAIVGSTRYHDIVAAIDRVEIGYTFYAQRWQRTHVNTACKLLLLDHAFTALGCAVVGFRVDGLNLRSQEAMLALGAKREGVLRHFQERRDGTPRDVHMFSIVRDEWAAVRQRLEARLHRHRS